MSLLLMLEVLVPLIVTPSAIHLGDIFLFCNPQVCKISYNLCLKYFAMFQALHLF